MRGQCVPSLLNCGFVKKGAIAFLAAAESLDKFCGQQMLEATRSLTSVDVYVRCDLREAAVSPKLGMLVLVCVHDYV